MFGLIDCIYWNWIQDASQIWYNFSIKITAFCMHSIKCSLMLHDCTILGSRLKDRICKVFALATRKVVAFKFWFHFCSSVFPLNGVLNWYVLAWFELQLHGVDDNIGKSRKFPTGMSKRMDRSKWAIDSIDIVLVLDNSVDPVGWAHPLRITANFVNLVFQFITYSSALCGWLSTFSWKTLLRFLSVDIQSVYSGILKLCTQT